MINKGIAIGADGKLRSSVWHATCGNFLYIACMYVRGSYQSLNFKTRRQINGATVNKH